MNLLQVQKKFGKKQKCIAFLERLRWGKEITSPYTGKTNITKRKGSYIYHCNDTNKDFTVLKDTIFEDSKLPLPKWFMLIALMINAKRGISSSQIARDLGISYKTAWYCQMRVRCAMISPELKLDGIVQMDEAFIGGDPRKKPLSGEKDDENAPTLSEVTNKRGRGTSKASFVGIVQPKGKVVVKVINKLSTRNLLAMLRRYVKMDSSIVVTDGYSSYKAFEKYIDHVAVKHGTAKKGMLNTNAIEGFFSTVKSGIKGNYTAISLKYLPFYLVEFEYKYNLRNEEKGAFETLIKRALLTEKELIDYKPTKQVRTIVYKKEPKIADYKKTKGTKPLILKEKQSKKIKLIKKS